MNQVEKAARFAELHVKGAPLLLYNAWDAGTAKSILDAGAKAIATSSWAVAEAQGYRDGESIPITFVEQIIARIVSAIDAPVSVDFEGGDSDDNGALAENVTRLFELGIIGINFEDRVVQGAGLALSQKRGSSGRPGGGRLPAWISSLTVDIGSRRRSSSARSGFISGSH